MFILYFELDLMLAQHVINTTHLYIVQSHVCHDWYRLKETGRYYTVSQIVQIGSKELITDNN